MTKELKEELKNLTFAGYYEDDKTFTIEILKEDLIKFLKTSLGVDNIKII